MVDDAQNETAVAVKRQRKAAAPRDDLEGYSPPLKLKKDYRPIGVFWLEEDDDLHESTDAFENNKVKAGQIIRVPIEEGRRLNSLELATRCDGF